MVPVTCLKCTGYSVAGAWGANGSPKAPCTTQRCTTRAGLHAEPAQVPPSRRCPNTAGAHLKDGILASTAVSEGAKLPHKPTHKYPLCLPSYWITEKEALKLQENWKLWSGTSRDRQPFPQEQVSMGLCCWLAAACQVLLDCCRAEDRDEHHGPCLLFFPLRIFRVKD